MKSPNLLMTSDLPLHAVGLSEIWCVVICPVCESFFHPCSLSLPQLSEDITKFEIYMYEKLAEFWHFVAVLILDSSGRKLWRFLARSVQVGFSKNHKISYLPYLSFIFTPHHTLFSHKFQGKSWNLVYN